VSPHFAGRPARILIVDDERHNRSVLDLMLVQEGFELLTATNGTEALALVASDPPDLILLDVMMPDLDGYTVASRIKSDFATRNIPIIMVSALDSHEARMAGLSAGAEDFLTRPIDRAEVRMRVRNLLRLKAYGDHYDKYSQQLESEVQARTAELIERSEAAERQSALIARRSARESFALGAARMGLWEVDLVTQQITWSQSMAPLYGLTEQEAPTTRSGFVGLIHPDDRDRVDAALTLCMVDGTGHEMEFRVVWPDGSLHWLAGRAHVHHDATGKPERMIGIALDISERKSLEEQFRHAQKTEAVGQLAGGVAHDFNNILTAILLYTSMVLDTFDPADERRADLAEVVNAGKRATALTRQLLAFSRKQVLQPTSIDLNALVLGMQPMLGRLIGEQVELVSMLAPDIRNVRADHGQIEQVLLNLAVNARDAMPEGGRLAIETANVELDGSFQQDVVIQPGAYVMLAVSDSGIGMDESTRGRLFEPFFTTKAVGMGTGLGLATVYGIVKQSGGYIWVYSEPGKGATFKVYLPCAVAEAGLETLSIPPLLRATAGTESVLIVEDELAVRMLMRRILENVGYHVVDAASPQDALALHEQSDGVFDLLLTDVIMPGLSGPRLFETLSRRQPGLKVLYVSGYADDTLGRQGELEPGVHFVEKPFTAQALYKGVRDVLDADRPLPASHGEYTAVPG
jgi:two-component system cell cycle sensor histidine kinase/response regulator CckA